MRDEEDRGLRGADAPDPAEVGDPSAQLAWHRWGGTPGQTAAVIDALLDDLGAAVGSVGHHAGARGLSELFGRDHMYCVELGRDVLLEARRSPTVLGLSCR
ncbi:hypothetical protein GCM10017778_69190 [Streptomyces vinaceus]|nr:hypothetical protein GCM10017778_69190 [Streptomyces vinaceus]